MRLIPQRISSKIWAMVAVITATLLFIVLISFRSKSQTQERLTVFGQHSAISNEAGRQLVSRFDAQLKAYQDSVISGELSLIEDASSFAEEVERALKELKSIASNSNALLINQFSRNHESFTLESTQLYPQLMGDDPSDEVYERSAVLAQQKTELREQAVAITLAISEQFANEIEAQINSINRNKVSELITALVVVVILIGMVTLIVRSSINRPFERFINQVKKLTEGDLTVHFEESRRDEINQLGKYLNRYVNQLKETVIDLGKDSIALTDLSVETKDAANQMFADSEEMGSQTKSASSAGMALSDEISIISENTDEMSNSSNSVASAIEEMNAAISEVAQQCAKQSAIVEDANQKAHAANELMNELGQAAKEIRKIVDMINAIAAQTNLLALNATIEAASAGEAGKGFAVVANEVKDLARQSSESSDRIRVEIENIHQKTEASVTSVTEIAEIMDQVSTYSNSIAASIEEQSATNQEISSTMQSVSNVTVDISSTVKASSESASSVAETIQHVSDRIENLKNIAGTTQAHSTQLSDLSAQLKSVISNFKTS